MLASQAVRSRQTAAYLAQYYTVLPALNPNIPAQTLPRLLETFDSKGNLVIVGHQPWLGELSAFLFNSHWNSNAYWSYKKGGFWWLQVKRDSHGFHTKLKAALTPEILSG